MRMKSSIKTSTIPFLLLLILVLVREEVTEAKPFLGFVGYTKRNLVSLRKKYIHNSESKKRTFTRPSAREHDVPYSFLSRACEL